MIKENDRTKPVDVPLAYPDFWKGEPIKALTVRVPFAKDLVAAAELGKGGLGQAAILCDVSIDLIGDLHMKDIERIRKTVESFMPTEEEMLKELETAAAAEGDKPFDVALWYPPMVSGVETKTLTMNVPRGSHLIDAAENATSMATHEFHIFSSLCEREEGFMNELHACDYARLQCAYKVFLA